MGYESIKPIDIIGYLQMWRRKLRALKYQGIRQIRIRNDEKLLNNCHGRCDSGIIQAILTSFARALSCQTPDVFEQMCELLAAQQKKNSKCSVSFS